MSKRLRSPIRWFGGKGNMAAKLLPILETIPHRRYVEPFGGGASLLMGKRPVEIEVYNDIDQGLVNLFRVLADPEQFAQFRRRVEAMPYARALWTEARETWDQEADPVRRAALWFVVARQSFSGDFGSSWSSVVTASCRGMAETASKWLTTIERLPEVHGRLRRVQIECADWRTILDRYDTSETLFYLDPPYVHGTRKAGGYAHELTDEDHADLVTVLLGIRGMAVLSGYAQSTYEPLERAGWRRTDWDTACHAAGKTRDTGIQGNGSAMTTQSRIESIWASPNTMLGGLFNGTAENPLDPPPAAK